MMILEMMQFMVYTMDKAFTDRFIGTSFLAHRIESAKNQQQNQNAFPATADTILASNQKSQSSAQSKRPENQSSNVSNKIKDN
jgi:hypothetical protein